MTQDPFASSAPFGRERLISYGAWAIVVLFSLASFGQSMALPFSHDEHQFVAGGALLAEGSLPYRDFPFHHLPNLLFLYAMPSLVTQKLLLAARILSALLGAGTLLLVFLSVRKAWQSAGALAAALAGLGAAGITLGSPLYGYTSGRAWNHDLAVFSMLAAFTVLTSDRPPSLLRSLAGGVLAGIAVGTRATFLPAAPVLGSFVAWRTWPPARRGLERAFAFAVGGALGLTPSLALWSLGERGFVFGNLVYPQLNTTYRLELGHQVAMGIGSKLRYLSGQVLLQPSHAVLMVLLLGLTIGTAVYQARIGRPLVVAVLAAALALSLLLGSLAPTPSWYQYFYAPLPFLAVAAGHLGAALAFGPVLGPALAAALAGAALLMIVLRGDVAMSLGQVFRPQAWVPIQSHDLSLRIREEVDGGRVATLGPIVPLEAGLDIVPALATGPFTWRVAPLMDSEDRLEFGLWGPAEARSDLEADPPAAVLVGFEVRNEGFAGSQVGMLEEPLADFAEANGYRRVLLPAPFLDAPLVLWVR